MASIASNSQTIQLVLVVGLAVPIFVLFLALTSKSPTRGSFGWERQQKVGLADVGRQLHAVMASSFEKRRILSAAEYRLFAIVESELAARRNGYRVFAQTNLGEILKSNNQDGF